MQRPPARLHPSDVVRLFEHVFKILTWLLAALILSACSNDFAPYSRLDRLRLLAIQSEPATPLPGQGATLTALVFTPGSTPPSFHWTWCPVDAPASGGYACPIDQAGAQAALASALDSSAHGLVPSLDLGTMPSAVFTNPFSLSALSTLCRQGLDSPAYAQAFDCEGGFPVTLALDISTGTTSLRAGMVLRLPATDPPEINHNPTVLGLTIAGSEIPDAPGAVVVAAGTKSPLVADIPLNATEVRSVPASEGGVGQRLERLAVSWFSDLGSFDKDRTSFIDGVAPLEQASRNVWTAPAAESWPADGAAELAVVVRDDRGGVGWLRRNPALQETP